MARFPSLLLVLGFVAMSGGCVSAGGDRLRAFATDGCSMFFDGTPTQRELWKHCCYAHDKAYWRGGTREERKEADEELRTCVDRVEDEALAELMYRGVRAGGGPCWPASYRWGYGWPYGRGYRALSEDEAKLADVMLAASEAAMGTETDAARSTDDRP
jgi:hypothetical protein